MNNRTNNTGPLPDEAVKAGLEFAMDTMKRVPTDTPEALEAHLTGVLILFWAALWGTMGTEYARDFIASQLRGMEEGRERDVFTPPRVQ